MNTLKHLLLLVVLAVITSCSADLADYENKSPTFDIKSYFTGEFIAWGMVQDYTSKVTRRFCVELKGSWQDNEGKLEETFYFQDGEVSDRTWILTKLANNEYIGTAGDVNGVAKGGHEGFAFRWQYQLLIPIDGETYTFDMDDWMYQLDNNRVFNKTTMSKLGVALGEITLFFDKSLTEKKCR